jgi:hypothetical protein
MLKKPPCQSFRGATAPWGPAVFSRSLLAGQGEIPLLRSALGWNDSEGFGMTAFTTVFQHPVRK